MNRLSRSNALKSAAIISFLLGIYSFFMVIPFLARGAADLNTAADSPPYFIILLAFVLAILKIVGAYGAWVNQRWGIILTILANALDALAAAPGILFAPTSRLQIEATTGVVFGIVIVVLCLWRERKATMI